MKKLFIFPLFVFFMIPLFVEAQQLEQEERSPARVQEEVPPVVEEPYNPYYQYEQFEQFEDQGYRRDPMMEEPVEKSFPSGASTEEIENLENMEQEPDIG